MDPFYAALLLMSLGLLPLAVMVLSSYTKISIVLSLVRNALGLQQVPNAMVINALAIVLSVYIMYPVGKGIYGSLQENWPERGTPKFSELIRLADEAKDPLKQFLRKHAAPREKEFFFRSTRQLMDAENASSIEADDMVVLIPAFLTSEITSAFEIGFLIFLPFLVIDMVVANCLMALGMQMLSPNTVSLPFKLLLLVTLDGWTRLMHALVLSYR